MKETLHNGASQSILADIARFNAALSGACLLDKSDSSPCEVSSLLTPVQVLLNAKLAQIH